MIGSLMMCVSVVVLLLGMLAGIAMGITQNFMLAPAHAHLNLVGGALTVFAGMVMFTVIVFRTAGSGSPTHAGERP